MNYWKQSNRYIYVAAHRGWRAKYPENTMEAFKAALDLGVDQIETDVHITKDGALVLIHDATVDRTTNGTGKVEDMTLKELQALDAGGGNKIPQLTDLMELVKDHPTITLDIELKEYPTDGRESLSYSVCDRVLQIIDDYGFTDRCVINTWNGKLHEYINATYGSKFKQHGKPFIIVDTPLRHHNFLAFFPAEHKRTSVAFHRGQGKIGDCRIGDPNAVLQSICVIPQTAAQYERHRGADRNTAQDILRRSGDPILQNHMRHLFIISYHSFPYASIFSQ